MCCPQAQGWCLAAGGDSWRHMQAADTHQLSARLRCNMSSRWACQIAFSRLATCRKRASIFCAFSSAPACINIAQAWWFGQRWARRSGRRSSWMQMW
jgi:hypothetical protein